MDYKYVSIGTQCTVPTLFENLGIKKETLPFDWMFSTPEFIYTILKLLLIDKIDINTIVEKDFFLCDKKASTHMHMYGTDHHTINPSGNILVNSKYDVTFPHDTLDDITKYIRRFNRLYGLISDKTNFIYFVYISSPSPSSAYTIDGKRPIQDLYNYINKINSLIKSMRNNYKILVFNTGNDSEKILNDENIIYINLQEKSHWKELLPQLESIFNYFFSNNLLKKPIT